MVESPEIGPSCHDTAWLALPLDAWLDTYTTLHMWTQIVGKIRLALMSHVNHWWQVPLYVTATGLTTSPMAYQGRVFQIDFDFLDHSLSIAVENGERRTLTLAPRSVADFYNALMAALRELDIQVSIWTVPVEVQERIPFEQDTEHAAYDAEYVQRFWRILVQADRVLKTFRAPYQGKVSPVHFFWGGFDLAVTRFSGRRAPDHPGVPNVARSVMREAYSHEVSSCGFWPGAGLGMPAFYAYAYPEPAGFQHYPVAPAAAFYSESFGEFLLPYDAVRTASAPDELLLACLQTTYEAADHLAQWDRAGWERAPEPV
jgi:hypothetical protein